MKRSKTQAERLLDLDRRLKNSEYPNCTSFAEHWEISTKTAQRDIDFLRDRMGAPIEYDALNRGYYYTEPTFMLPAVQMNEGELAALLMGSKMLEISYRNWRGEMTYRVSPVHLANLQGDWYLFVQFEGHDNFRQIALSRIQSIKLLKNNAQIIGSFDAEKELADTFSRFAGQNEPFKVTVQFSKEIADEVLSRQWHPKQEAKLLKDGRVEISFDAKGDIEIKRWVMAFGRTAKVKSPKWLKEQITEEVNAMLETG